MNKITKIDNETNKIIGEITERFRQEKGIIAKANADFTKEQIIKIIKQELPLGERKWCKECGRNIIKMINKL